MAVVEIDLHTLSEIVHIRKEIKSLEAEEEVLINKLVTAIREVGSEGKETQTKQGG